MHDAMIRAPSISKRRFTFQARAWAASLSLMILALSTTLPLVAPTHLSAVEDLLELPSSQDEPTFTIKFNNIDVVELVEYIGQISDKNFIYDESQLRFKVSIVSDEPATAEQLLAMLLQILRMNNLYVTEEGSNILIYAKRSEKDENYLPAVVSKELSNEMVRQSGIVTRVFKVKYANPRQVASIISKLATHEDNVDVHDGTGHVIVVDTAKKIEHIEALIKTVDQLDSTIDFEVYKVKHANISGLKAYAEKIMGPISGGGVTSGSESSDNKASNAASGNLTLIPNISGNTLFIIGSRQLIDKTLSVLKLIDVPSELETLSKKRAASDIDPYATDPSKILDRQINPEFYIYKLQYHRGDQIMTSLKEIATTMGGSQDTLDPKLTFALQTVQWLESTNSLIFSGDDASIIKLKNLIMSLDTPVKQVFIEMLIVDTTIANSLDFGIDLGANLSWPSKGLGATIGRYSATSSLPGAIAAAHEAQIAGVPPASLPGFGMGVIGHALSHKGQIYHTLGAMVKALQVDSDTNILMNPKLITEDNMQAQYFVGSQTRVKTGIVDNSGQNNVTSSNYEIMDIGTKISVTPTISHDELITIQLTQEVSNSLDPGQASDSTPLVPLTSTSKTTTRMHVPDGQFLVIAGMSEDHKQKSNSTMPCLGGIPIIRHGVSHESGSGSMRNLLIFIRPTIVRTPEEARILTEKYRDVVRLNHSITPHIERQTNFLGD